VSVSVRERVHESEEVCLSGMPTAVRYAFRSPGDPGRYAVSGVGIGAPLRRAL
jgi:hypothetical protein